MSFYLGFEPKDQLNYYFVSYNNEDADRVAPLACELAKSGIPLWYDYGILYGRKWATQINEKISGSQAMILFFTKGILLKEDSYVQKEYKIAKLVDRPIIVLILDKIEKTEIPVSKLDWWIDITDNQCLDVYSLKKQTGFVSEVKRALKFEASSLDDMIVYKKEPLNSTAEQGTLQSVRPLFFTWLIDCSGSMFGYKLQTVNYAIYNAILVMRDKAINDSSFQLMIGTISFSNGAKWETPGYVEAENYFWQDLEASGCTDLGHAVELVVNELDSQRFDENALPPILCILTDGLPSDDYKNALNKLNNRPWGKNAIKIAIGIGDGVSFDFLKELTGNKEWVFQADTAQKLAEHIKWVAEMEYANCISSD